MSHPSNAARSVSVRAVVADDRVDAARSRRGGPLGGEVAGAKRRPFRVQEGDDFASDGPSGRCHTNHLFRLLAARGVGPRHSTGASLVGVYRFTTFASVTSANVSAAAAAKALTVRT